ncbi:hypothetical protein ACFFX0_21895 [Citricoccus parietis]|uniref:Uncharacterized protein n=1 Tax=Citricoccus parietis TaxID=592307 RepID=A0ABV5G439_9MICC
MRARRPAIRAVPRAASGSSSGVPVRRSSTSVLVIDHPSVVTCRWVAVFRW